MDDNELTLYAMLKSVGIIILLMVVVAAMILLFAYFASESFRDLSTPVCEDVCDSHGYVLEDVRSGGYSNAVCVCKDVGGALWTFTV